MPHRPRANSLPRLPGVPPQKRKTEARPAVILGLQGSLPEPPATPAKTQNFLCVLFRVGFPKQPAEPAALTEPPRLRGLRSTKNTGRAATAAAKSGSGFGASY